MLELQAALARILAAVPPPTAEEVPLCEAHGRVLAEPVRAPLDLPPFDNSAMDGYAVRAADVAQASLASPVRLRVAGNVPAGQGTAVPVASGTCARVFTGSPLPPGADAVVMQEDTRLEPNQPGAVLVQEPAQLGEHVRPRGQDFRRGALAVEAGELLTAGRLGLLAALGQERVKVGRQPSVGVLATGSELREPGQRLAAGEIYESNRWPLAALICRAGGRPRVFPPVPDTPAATRSGLAEALEQCELVVTSGGVSVGELDLVRPALAEIGGSVEFWQVAIKPGRPFVLGRKGAKLVFGLPGNPVSALVTFLLLARPALLRWQGARQVLLPTHPGVLAEPLENPDPRPHFLRIRVDETGQVRSAGRQASHVLSSLAAANGLVEVPATTTLAASSQVRVLRWE